MDIGRFVEVQSILLRCSLFSLCNLEIGAMLEPSRLKLMVETISLVKKSLVPIKKFGGYIVSKTLCWRWSLLVC